MSIDRGHRSNDSGYPVFDHPQVEHGPLTRLALRAKGTTTVYSLPHGATLETLLDAVPSGEYEEGYLTLQGQFVQGQTALRAALANRQEIPGVKLV